jgi:hypothetical protein
MRNRLARMWISWLAVAIVLVLLGMEAGVLLARSQTADDAAALREAEGEAARLQAALAVSEERNWNYYRETQALQEELARLREGTSGGGGQGPAGGGGAEGQPGTFTDGVYLVGEEIPPGTYNGVVSGETGYWARLKNTTGMIDGIITNAVQRGPFILTVLPSDAAVELRGVTIISR